MTPKNKIPSDLYDYMDDSNEEVDGIMEGQEPEDLEGQICSACNGSGMGLYDGSKCTSCGGSGEVKGNEEDDGDEEYDRMKDREYDTEREPDMYMTTFSEMLERDSNQKF